MLAATWVYAALILAVLALVHWVGEAWWGVTVLLFVPRWLFLAPIPVLALASAVVRQPSHWVFQGTIALVIAGPIMGASLPLRQLWAPPVEGRSFRLLCYNRGADPIDTARLIAMIERERVDLISFQEGIPPDPVLDAYLARGWSRDRSRWLASREPIVAELPPLPDDTTTEERMSARLTRVRIRAATGEEFILASVHLPTIRPGLNRVLAGDLRGLKLHLDWWASELDRVATALADPRGIPLLVAGDFNMPSDDSSMAGLRSSLRFGFEEAGWGLGYTRPSRSPWFRIDHILASPDCTFTRCWVGADFGSDHLPLLADVVVPRGSAPTLAAPP